MNHAYASLDNLDGDTMDMLRQAIGNHLSFWANEPRDVGVIRVNEYGDPIETHATHSQIIRDAAEKLVKAGPYPKGTPPHDTSRWIANEVKKLFQNSNLKISSARAGGYVQAIAFALKIVSPGERDDYEEVAHHLACNALNPNFR